MTAPVVNAPRGNAPVVSAPGGGPDLLRDLPADLPQGERLLWQGRPHWRLVARQVLHWRVVALYFAVLLAWYAVSALADGRDVADVLASLLRFGLLSLLALGLIGGYAWLIGRTTAYVVTSRRVIIRFGIALPMTVNVPFKQIEAANARIAADGSGGIALSVTSTGQLGYLVLWPNVRPWRLAKAEPMLRGLRDGAKVAQVLARALAASASAPVPAMALPAAPAPVRGGRATAAA